MEDIWKPSLPQLTKKAPKSSSLYNPITGSVSVSPTHARAEFAPRRIR
jgi:hypothetical protein